MTLGESLKCAERYCLEGRLTEAEKLCRDILETRPDVPEAEHLLGIIAHQNGKLGDAIAHAKRAAQLAPNVALYHANLGEMLRLAGRVEDAITEGRRAVELDPHYPGAFSNLGIALFDQSRFEDALAHYDRAIALRGNFAQAHSNRGNALQRLKRFTEAEAAYRRAIALWPDFGDAWNNLGTCLRELKRPEEAEAAYRRAAELKPNDPETLDNLALAVKDLNRLGDAADILCRALALEQRSDKFHMHYGNVLLDQHKIAEAAVAIERAVEINPNNHDAINLMGRIAFERADFESALVHYRRALAIKPDFADAYNNMGNVFKERGQLTDAEASYREALRLDPALTGAYVNLADLRKFAPGDPLLAAMETLAAKTEGLSQIDRMQLDFALSKAYADLEDYFRSFQFMLAGNARKRATISYNETSVSLLFERIETLFTRELIAQKSGGGNPSRMPVFIIGMPRSGTTLVEQILASHRKVHGAGELQTFSAIAASVHDPSGNVIVFPEFAPSLDRAALEHIGTRYIASIHKLLPQSAEGYERATDKMPSNYYFAGLIHLALPNAKIIHVIRDPVDTCLSCFSKLFTAAQNHTYDLGEIGRYYKRYQYLMAHWYRVLPAGRILDVRYEDVIADIEGEARRIIAHCELPWDDRCVAFYETTRAVRTASAAQVRQPIYQTSVGRWRAYRDNLGPLFDALGVDASTIE